MPERYRYKIISNIVVLFSGSLAAQLATVATLFLPVRAPGRDNYGVYAVCLAHWESP
jgi:O-antigen/teichoic acid export membrane protein